jgi:uncharacterized membrane protein
MRDKSLFDELKMNLVILAFFNLKSSKFNWAFFRFMKLILNGP